MREKVEEALNEVRSVLQADGGGVSLVDVTDDGIVKVQLEGRCAGCPMSQMTLQMVIQQHLQAKVPEVKAVEAV